LTFPQEPEDELFSRSSSGVVCGTVPGTGPPAHEPDALMHTGTLMDELFAAVRKAEESVAPRSPDPDAPGATQGNQEEREDEKNEKLRVRTVPATASSEPG